jgi:uncharacterized protein (DUF362 family)
LQGILTRNANGKEENHNMDHKPVVSIVHHPEAPDAGQIYEMVQEAITRLKPVSETIQPGDTVVIKANIFAPFPPPISADRRVIAAVVRIFKEAGARKVTVVEGVSVGTRQSRGYTSMDNMVLLGVKTAVEEAGGEIVSLDHIERVWVDVPSAFILHRIEYPKLMLEADVLVDLACLKTHSLAMVTLGIKNFQGILSDEQKYEGHRDDLCQHLVDIHRVRQPDLTIIDGLIGMEGNGAGEYGIPVPMMNLILAGDNVVAVDAVASAVMGIEDPLDVQTTRLAAYAGLGTADLENIEVRGKSIQEVQRKYLLPLNFSKPLDRFVTGCYPNIRTYVSGACPMCWMLASAYSYTLSKYPEPWTLIFGADPKLPPSFDGDLDHVIVMGDCAMAATGKVKELRNRMLLEEKGVLAGGCPPFRPAESRIEKQLVKLGLLTLAEKRARFKQKQAMWFEIYRSVDPTWEPEEVTGIPEV